MERVRDCTYSYPTTYKTSEVYNELLELVLSHVTTRPRKIIVNFKLAVHKTFERLVHNIEIIDCLFHWEDALFRQVNKIKKKILLNCPYIIKCLIQSFF